MRIAAREVRTPDYIEPIVGWRIWHVVEAGGRLRLRSPLYRTSWPPREELVAACQRGAEWRPGRRSHAPPDARCGCGISAGQTATNAAAYLSRFFKHGPDVLHRVLGLVSLWGQIVECEYGWRGSHAYPALIYVPAPRPGRLGFLRSMPRPAVPVDEIALGLAHYGIPVEVIECGTVPELVAQLVEPAMGILTVPAE